ncbi:LamG domain-containing protein [Patescibacteria group bacterium]|nr:LamG domain-containing protein [Patescibacteria group bacterium]
MTDNAQVLTYRPLPGAMLNMAHPLTQGLVGCWLLNENSGIRAMDLSPYANHGTLTNFDSPPRRSFNGLNFDGVDDRVTIPHKSIFDITSTLTVETWLKPNAGYGEGTPRIVDKDLYSAWTIYLTAASGTFSLNLFIDGVIRSFFTTAVVPINTWTHTMSTFDGTTANIYFNAVNVLSSAAFPGVIGTNATSIYLGDVGNGTRVFNGRIALVRIYNRALGADEIKRLYISPYGMIL